MMRIAVPDLDDRPLTMEREDGARLPAGQGDDAGSGLDGRLRLGGPLAVPVSEAYVESEHDLRTFVEREAERYRYHLVHLSITAISERHQPRFERIELELDLTAQGSGAEKPIAWSMMPARVDDPSQMSTTWHLGPQLKLLDLSVEHTESRPSTQPYLEALNELRSDPTWELRRTRGMEIGGVHRFMLVVRAPAGATTLVGATVRAATAHGPRLWRGRAGALSDALALTVEL